jgi:acetyltransferase-like isoleucine patch superfamily enzyme/lysophospholipase L1-like esterase
MNAARRLARHVFMTFRRWRHGLRNVHSTFYMAAGSQVSRDLVAREYSYVGPECRLGPQVELGPYSMIGPRVSIVGGDHRFDQPGIPIIFSGRPILKPTVIEADAWIGNGAILMAGVRIGRGSIVAAGAVVSRDVPPYEVHGGVPARKIRDRFASQDERDVHDHMLSQPPHRGEYCPPLQEANGPKPRHRASILAAGAILLLAASEICLRAIWGLADPPLLQKDSEIGSLYQPNQRLRRLGNEIFINAYHQRCAAVQSHPSSGTLRVLVVGDSVTFGTTLDQSEIFTSLLPGLIRPAQPASVEVLNASADSWGIGNQLAYLRRFGTFDSSYVILQIGSHDLVQRKSTCERVGIDPALPTRRPRLALGEAWTRYLRPRFVASSSVPWKVRPDDPEIAGRFEQNLVFLTETIRFVRARRAILLIVHTPNRDEVAMIGPKRNGQFDRWRARFLRTAAAENVPVLDLTKRWCGGSESAHYFFDAVHLTEEGHQAVANELGLFIQELTPSQSISVTEQSPHVLVNHEKP